MTEHEGIPFEYTVDVQDTVRLDDDNRVGVRTAVVLTIVHDSFIDQLRQAYEIILSYRPRWSAVFNMTDEEIYVRAELNDPTIYLKSVPRTLLYKINEGFSHNGMIFLRIVFALPDGDEEEMLNVLLLPPNIGFKWQGMSPLFADPWFRRN